MRTMYDAVNAQNIPPGATMVAGYGDTIHIPQWTATDWARFPNAIKVVIVKRASTSAGHVLDVETGDATPAQAPGWVLMRRAAGADPTVYCNSATWPAVRAAFAAARVAEPHYMIAKYDGVAAIPMGAIAKQFRNTPGYDVSIVADYWPGVDPAPGGNVALTNDDIGLLMQYGILRDGGDPTNKADYVHVGETIIAAADAALEVAVLKGQLAALQAATAPQLDADTLAAIVAVGALCAKVLALFPGSKT